MDREITWNDYDGFEWGSSTQSEVDELNKALYAGDDVNDPGVSSGEGFPLRMESLDNTLKVTAYRMEHIKLWKNTQKLPAYNTVEEYNLLSSYGENLDSGFQAEGILPEEVDSTYERKTAQVKYMGVTGQVSHPMTLVRSAHGNNAVALETVNKTMHLLKMVERGLFYADSSLSTVQFDGYIKLLEDNAPSGNIFDLRGLPLTQDNLDDAAMTIFDAPNYGMPTDLYAAPTVISDFAKTFHPKERHGTFAREDGLVGSAPKGFVSGAGNVMFNPDVFLTDGGAPNASAIGDSTKIPAAPSITTVASTPASGTSQFVADDAGDYYMKVVACNRYGRAAAIAVDAGAISVLAGDKITFGVTPGGSTTVEWWEIYRSQKGGAVGDQRLVLRVANAAGAGESILSEENAKIPYTTDAILFQGNIENMGIKQLCPLLKLPLATLGPMIRWSMHLYIVPLLYTPGKNILIKNIGRNSSI